MQKKYGEQADHAQLRDAAFQKALGRFTYHEVEQAFQTYTSRHDDMPHHSNILNILEPPPPVLDKVVYLAIKQKMKWSMFVGQDERKYCECYEQQELGKLEAWERHAKRIKSSPPEYRQLAYEPEEDDELDDA